MHLTLKNKYEYLVSALYLSLLLLLLLLQARCSGHVLSDDREEAFRCFKEAVKIKFDSVKLWENLTVIAMVSSRVLQFVL